MMYGEQFEVSDAAMSPDFTLPLDKAAVVPKERVISLEPPTHIKARRKDAKQHASKKKQSRRGGVPAF